MWEDVCKEDEEEGPDRSDEETEKELRRARARKEFSSRLLAASWNFRRQCSPVGGIIKTNDCSRFSNYRIGQKFLGHSVENSKT